MNTNAFPRFVPRATLGPRPIRVLLALPLISVLLSLPASAANRRASSFDDPHSGARSVQLPPGPITVAATDNPAATSFDRPEGKAESASEGAALATRKVLTTPNLGHPQVNAAVGVVQFVAAPFAAVYGAISSARQKLPADKLSESEAELTSAMNDLAAQEHLRNLLLEQTNLLTRLLIPNSADVLEHKPLSARLETRVDRLSLHRAGGRDKFALKITARARLVRDSDAALVYDRQYQFQSGTALFVDWARYGGFESVARSGYRQLAEQIAKDLAACTTEPPLFLGAGYLGASRKQQSRLQLIPADSPGQSITLLAFKPSPGVTAQFARLAHSPDDFHSVQFANSQASDTADYQLFSSGRSAFLLQLPSSKEQAVDEAQSDTEWQLDGLPNDSNFVVQAAGCLAAVPIGLWEQSVALWRGLSAKKIAAGQARLEAAARRDGPGEAVALAVARELKSSPILPAKSLGSSRRPGDALSGRSQRGQNDVIAVADHLDLEPTENVLEIRVLRASLSGKPGINPPLALDVEARARVLRAADGLELYSAPLFYRSRERHFRAWAAHDAQAFRQELESCYRQMGSALAAELASRGLAPASHRSVLARN